MVVSRLLLQITDHRLLSTFSLIPKTTYEAHIA